MGHPDIDQRELARMLIDVHELVGSDKLLNKPQEQPMPGGMPGGEPGGMPGGMPEQMPMVGPNRSPSKPSMRPENVLPGRAMAGGQM
jgi:hypothetical protein